MRNIVSYINEEQRTFAESPFNPVDSLVFSTLAYLNYEQVPLCVTTETNAPLDASGRARVRLHDIVSLCDWKTLSSHCWLQDAKDTEAFFQAIRASRRLRDVEVGFYANEYSDAVEKQFSAVTLFFSAGADTHLREPIRENAPETYDTYDACEYASSESSFADKDKQSGMLMPSILEYAYLSFRGTDGSFSGWKEDFNLCFKDIIPSQCTAAAYVSGVASACTCPLILGGHSKGGNLAEYAALVTDNEVFDRICRVFNHDGPSFLDDPSPRMNSPRFGAILHKTVPESSAFGMILERRQDYRVVQSSAMSVFQHEPFTWQTEGLDFVYQESLNRSAVFFDETLDGWLRSKTSEERERFIDTIYELLMSTEANSWAEFQDKLLLNLKTVVDSGSRLDAETRVFIRQTIGSLGGVIKAETLKRFKPSPRTLLPQKVQPYEGFGAAVRAKLPRRKNNQDPEHATDIPVDNSDAHKSEGTQ